MNKLLSILSLLLFVSCGDTYDYRESDTIAGTGEVDAELSVYLERFEDDMGVTIPDHLSINVVETLENVYNSNVDAVCWSRGGVGEKIEIRRSRWEELSEASREQLLYHELGHCVLDKGHKSGNRWGSQGYWCPPSIMNPYTFTERQIDSCYKPDHVGYLNELRN